MTPNQSAPNADMSLAVRAAWLHYVGGMRQSDVAKRLGIAKVKAHRLIARANQEELVKVSIEGDIAECVELGMTVTKRFNLDFCEVVPNLYESDMPLRALGVAGARFLHMTIVNGQNNLIGVGHGRTLAACVSCLSSVDAKHVRFVSLLGGVTRNFEANPHDVMHRLASKITTHAYVMPVPFFANSEDDRKTLLAQRGVSEVMRMAEQSPLKFVGIGSVEPNTQLVLSGMVEEQNIKEVKSLGGIGEILGHFFTVEGQVLETKLARRTLSVGLSSLEQSNIVAVAGGIEKTQAIEAGLMSGFVNGLITDECTAHALLAS